MKVTWRVLPAILLVVACTTDPEPTATTPLPDPTTEIPATTIGSTTTAGPTATTFPTDVAPPELAGTWRGEIAPGDTATLTLNRNSYSISRGGNSGSGVISVDGDQITFSGSDICEGEGTYTWIVDGDSLDMTITDAADACGGRAAAINGITYTR